MFSPFFWTLFLSCFSLIPFLTINDSEVPSISEFLGTLLLAAESFRHLLRLSQGAITTSPFSHLPFQRLWALGGLEVTTELDKDKFGCCFKVIAFLGLLNKQFFLFFLFWLMVKRAFIFTLDDHQNSLLRLRIRGQMDSF